MWRVSRPTDAPPISVLSTLVLVITTLAFGSDASPSHPDGPRLPPSASNVARTTDPIRFVSPLRSFTIFDKTPPSPAAPASATATPSPSPSLSLSPRRRFVGRFRAGLVAERKERDAIEEEKRARLLQEHGGGDDDDDSATTAWGEGWAEMEAAKEELRRATEEARVERAHDVAVSSYDRRERARSTTTKASASGDSSLSSRSSLSKRPPSVPEYQFVGVVNNGKSSSTTTSASATTPAVTWYARRKPFGSKWSVRLVHVDRDAVVRDLITSGKADLYGRYSSAGRHGGGTKSEMLGKNGATTAARNDDAPEATLVKVPTKTSIERKKEEEDRRNKSIPVLESQYTIKERSWRTLWNFSPLRLFSDSSGMYWRERRLMPGLYTDGYTVYESAYDYSLGVNGMKPISLLDAYLSKKDIDTECKSELMKRLDEDKPDVVMEE